MRVSENHGRNEMQNLAPRFSGWTNDVSSVGSTWLVCAIAMVLCTCMDFPAPVEVEDICAEA